MPAPIAETVQRLRILDVPVDDITWEETLDAIQGFIDADASHQLVTLNPELVMLARRNPAFKAVVEDAAISSADGVGLQLAARLKGRRIRELVTGSGLIERAAEAGAPKGWRMFLLGAAEGIAEEVGKNLEQKFPGIEIVGSFSGSPRDEDAEQIVSRINSAGPVDILFVAYGSPAQEMWIAEHLEELDVRVAVGIGGGFNFIAGRSRRPPEWVRRANLIWLFRLITEPWRWRRQLVLLRFLALSINEALRVRAGLRK